MCLQTNKRRTILEDPTRQAGNRRRANADLNRRLKGAQKDVNAIIDSIPVRVSANNSIVRNRIVYTWDISPERQAQVDVFIRDIINAWFQTQTDERPARWFFQPYMESATMPAAADSVNNIKLLSQGVVSSSELSQYSVEQIFSDPQYRSVVENIYARAFNEMKGFSGETATDLARVLGDAILLGKSAQGAKRDISQRFSVAKSRAERIARTEINRAYTISRTTAAQETANDLGINIELLHRSSLTPTTRNTHAARHGNTYTIQEQNDWWDQGANRINCLCSVSEVVVDDDGRIRSRGLQKKMEKQKQTWMAVYSIK